MLRYSMLQIDHFHCQKDYPLLAISFYNLVPSCWPCNSNFKEEKPTDTKTHLHPHIGGFQKDCIFTITGVRNIDDILGKKAKKFKLNLENRKGDMRYDGNKTLFELENRYNGHQESAVKALECIRARTKADIKGIRVLVKSASLPYHRIMRTKYSFDTLHEEPFAKITRDIFDAYASAELKKLLGVL